MKSTPNQIRPKTIWYLATEPLDEVKQFLKDPPGVFKVEYIHNETELRSIVAEHGRYHSKEKTNPDIILLGDFDKTATNLGPDFYTSSDLAPKFPVSPKWFYKTDPKPFYVDFLAQHQIRSTVIPFSFLPTINRGLMQWAGVNQDFLTQREICVRGIGNNQDDYENPARLFQSSEGSRALLALIGERIPAPFQEHGVRRIELASY